MLNFALPCIPRETVSCVVCAGQLVVVVVVWPQESSPAGARVTKMRFLFFGNSPSIRNGKTDVEQHHVGRLKIKPTSSLTTSKNPRQYLHATSEKSELAQDGLDRAVAPQLAVHRTSPMSYFPILYTAIVIIHYLGCQSGRVPDRKRGVAVHGPGKTRGMY